MNFQTKNLCILCLGALIKSDWIVITKECKKILPPYNEIIVSIGRNYINNVTIDSTIETIHDINEKSKFIIIVVSSCIYGAKFVKCTRLKTFCLGFP